MIKVQANNEVVRYHTEMVTAIMAVIRIQLTIVGNIHDQKTLYMTNFVVQIRNLNPGQ